MRVFVEPRQHTDVSQTAGAAPGPRPVPRAGRGLGPSSERASTRATHKQQNGNGRQALRRRAALLGSEAYQTIEAESEKSGQRPFAAKAWVVPEAQLSGRRVSHEAVRRWCSPTLHGGAARQLRPMGKSHRKAPSGAGPPRRRRLQEATTAGLLVTSSSSFILPPDGPLPRRQSGQEALYSRRQDGRRLPLRFFAFAAWLA